MPSPLIKIYEVKDLRGVHPPFFDLQGMKEIFLCIEHYVRCLLVHKSQTLDKGIAESEAY